MKVFRLLVTLFVLLMGLVIGALNSSEVTLNFVFSSIHTTLGVAIVVSMLAGVLMGSGIVVLFSLLPAYSKLRQTNKALAQSTSQPSDIPAKEKKIDSPPYT